MRERERAACLPFFCFAFAAEKRREREERRQGGVAGMCQEEEF